MSRIAYVNGRYVPHRAASVHVEDRGYQFADAVYEVIALKDGVFIDEELHLRRLHRSLGELKIAMPMSDAALRLVLHEVARRNGVSEGVVYLQVSRGTAPRNFTFPAHAKPNMVVTARRRILLDPKLGAEGVRVITLPDIRWGRPDIKTVSLLPNALGKQQAKEAGAFEAWMVDRDGNVTEAGEVVTRQADIGILNGVTRLGLISLLAETNLHFIERPFAVAEAKAAREAFLTSSSNFVLPIVRIDDAAIGDGKPGPVTRRLRERFADYAAAGGSDR